MNFSRLDYTKKWQIVLLGDLLTCFSTRRMSFDSALAILFSIRKIQKRMKKVNETELRKPADKASLDQLF